MTTTTTTTTIATRRYMQNEEADALKYYYIDWFITGVFCTEGLVSAYVNIRFAFIFFRNIRHDYKHSYFPLLTLMGLISFVSMVSNLMFCVSTILCVFLDRIGTIAILFILVAPAHISLLDFLLCVHRIAWFFEFLTAFKTFYRWSAPTIYLLLAPLLVAVSAVALPQLITDTRNQTSRVANFYAMAFKIEISLRVAFSSMSVLGYSAILMAVNRQTKKRIAVARSSSEHSTVIRQALPIASFQFMTICFQYFMQSPYFPTSAPVYQKMTIDICLANVCAIVVPLSIIIGSASRREQFLSCNCSCLSRKVRPQVRHVSVTVSPYS